MDKTKASIGLVGIVAGTALGMTLDVTAGDVVKIDSDTIAVSEQTTQQIDIIPLKARLQLVLEQKDYSIAKCSKDLIDYNSEITELNRIINEAKALGVE